MELRTNAELSDDDIAKIEGSRAEEKWSRSFLLRDHSAAIKMQNRYHVEFAAHLAYSSIAEIVIFLYTRQIDGYIDWLWRM